MASSDKEIQQLLEKAKSYKTAGIENNDMPSYKKALECYDKIIQSIPNHPYYYERRAFVRYGLACMSGSTGIWHLYYLDGAINDISKAIELDPDRGEHYRLRGLYCFMKLSEQRIMNEQLSRRIIEDYHTSISKNPTQPQVWLHLLSLNLILQDYEEAISIYGQCKPHTSSKENQLCRAWLGCIVFILAGDPVEEEDVEPLHNQEIRFGDIALIQLIISPLKRLLEKEKNEESRKKVNEINKSLFSHIDDWFRRGVLLERFGCFEEALEAYEKAIEVNPNDAMLWNNKSWILQILRRHKEAIMAHNKAIEIDYANKNCTFVGKLGRKVGFLVMLKLIAGKKTVDTWRSQHI